MIMHLKKVFLMQLVGLKGIRSLRIFFTTISHVPARCRDDRPLL